MSLLSDRFFTIAAGMVLIYCPCLSAAADRPQPLELVQAAGNISDLSNSGPLEFNARVVFNPGTPREKSGRLMIYRDGDRFRHELHAEEYHEVEVRSGGKRYIARSLDYPSTEFFGRGDLDRLWQVTVSPDSKLSGVSTRNLDGARAYCFEIRSANAGSVTKCFDAAKKILLQSFNEVRTVKFSGYRALGERQFPGMIEVFEHGKLLRRIQDIEIEKASFQPTSFQAPPASREFDFCDDLKPAYVLRQPGPGPHDEVTRESNRIQAYAVVGADGMLHDIKVLDVTDASYEKVILGKLPEWRYTPAMCGKNPVASEIIIRLGSSMVVTTEPPRPPGRGR